VTRSGDEAGGGPRTAVAGGPATVTLWLLPAPRRVPDGDVGLVLDPAWTASSSGPPGLRSIRDVSDRVLRSFDPIEATSLLLDAWAAESGVIPALSVGATSWWFYMRLRVWLWLQERVLWAVILRKVVDEVSPGALACDPGAEPAAVLAASLLAEAERLTFTPPAGVPAAEAGARPGAGSPSSASFATTPASTGPNRPTAKRRPLPLRIAGRARRAVRRLLRGGRAAPPPARKPAMLGGETVEDRVHRLAREPGRPLLVVSTHMPQRIETPTGARFLNPYLGPIVDRLRGTALEPIVLDRHSRRAGDAQTAGPSGPGADRVLSTAALRVDEPAEDPVAKAGALASARSIANLGSAMPVAGIDLGPELTRHVAEDAVTWFPAIPHSVDRLTHLAEQLHVRGFLVADEYHRQDCLEAARRLGLPVAAVQHGTIYRRHNGYIHGARPPQLRLPDRTYVFGAWERELLLERSVYRPDEVVVGGSPRLDLFRPEAIDRQPARAELGVQPGERLIVLSGTYGAIYRRFHYPAVLARLFDRPMPGVRLVVKLHPAETDEGPYRAVIDGVAAAAGFRPVEIQIVQHVDLYRLLQAADAHLGIHSTVLTEAVFVGTRNLLASGVLGGDLLDYVAAGVAIPVTTGADLQRALDEMPTGAAAEAGVAAARSDAAAREAFIKRHYEPSSGSERIAQDLLTWLA
jgi:hypothetical protein